MAYLIRGMEVSGGVSRVTVESDIECTGNKGAQAIMELQSGGVRTAAMKYAAENGIADPRCGMPEAAYAVDDKGERVTRPSEQKVHRYRIDVPVQGRLV